MIEAPQFPFYIVSKGRHEYMVTSKVLTEIGVPHNIIVEPQEVDAYQDAVDRFELLATIIPLDMTFKEKYELCDKLGLSKSTGPGPARNFAWEHSQKNGKEWHWVMDDNIRSFRRMNYNEKVKVANGAIFKAVEDFCLRYENIGMAGPNYYRFVPARTKVKPLVMNTRIYSCNLIRNDVPFKWRGRYNEDTILSLDMLSAGWCTVQFNAFLQEKMDTQKLKGGNTSDFYLAEGKKVGGQKYADTGTLAKSRMLQSVYPLISEVVWRFNRWHHSVDYSAFKRNKLIRKPGIEISKAVNNYGMELIRKAPSEPMTYQPETPIARDLRFPIFIPSLGRHDSNLTARMLLKAGIPFKLVVESHEVELYTKAFGKEYVMPLPGKGYGDITFARNFIKAHANSQGYEYHWQMDDDISTVMKVRNRQTLTKDTRTVLCEVEDFVTNYEDVAVAGLDSSVWGRMKEKELTVNQLAYTIFLVKSDLPFEYRKGIEDLDFTLQCLTKGWSTIQFHKYIFAWQTTGKRKGGLTEINKDGRMKARCEMTMKYWPQLLTKLAPKSNGGYRIVTNQVWKRFTHPLRAKSHGKTTERNWQTQPSL